jgi:hypothetical protein
VITYPDTHPPSDVSLGSAVIRRGERTTKTVSVFVGA